ncbi:MAG: hypothetical protein KJ971_07520 [Firmicutes bacterium]|nr:hypothetical protein [Bacillota bacterium]
MSFFLTAFPINIQFLEITLPDIYTFVLGLFTGFVLLALFVAFFLITGRRKKSKIKFSKQTPLDDQIIESMIEAKQKELISTVKLTDNAYFKVAFDLSFDLMNEIAKYYFPDSKYPMYELSVQEILNLNFYITKRIETLVNSKFIRHFKNHRISTIINLLNKKKALDNSKLMKFNKKYKISKLYTVGRTVLNYANPIFWFRKLAIKPSTTLVTKEVCKFIISIFGEETNNIYSKKLFQEPDDVLLLEKEFDELVESEIEKTEV